MPSKTRPQSSPELQTCISTTYSPALLGCQAQTPDSPWGLWLSSCSGQRRWSSPWLVSLGPTADPSPHPGPSHQQRAQGRPQKPPKRCCCLFFPQPHNLFSTTARVMFSTHKLDYVIYWLKTHQCLPVSLGLKSRFLLSACLQGPVGTACYLSGLISRRPPLASVCALAAWPPCCSWTRTHTLLSWDMCLLFFCPERPRRCRARSCASFRSPLKCHPVGELP